MMSTKFPILSTFLIVLVLAFIVVRDSSADCSECNYPWSSWSECSQTCGGGGQSYRRRDEICCNNTVFKYGNNNYRKCLQSCNYTYGDDRQDKYCGEICQNNVVFDNKTHSCNCPLGYAGICCESSFDCTPGESSYVWLHCALDFWSEWTPCSSSCGGISRRNRDVCCDPRYKYKEDCIKACNLTLRAYEETRLCGKMCDDAHSNTHFTNDSCSPKCIHGDCHNGVCICSSMYQGVDCKQPNPWTLAILSILGSVILALLICCLCVLCSIGSGKKRKTEPSTEN